jgi:hypothetical protein
VEKSYLLFVTGPNGTSGEFSFKFLHLNALFEIFDFDLTATSTYEFRACVHQCASYCAQMYRMNYMPEISPNGSKLEVFADSTPKMSFFAEELASEKHVLAYRISHLGLIDNYGDQRTQ